MSSYEKREERKFSRQSCYPSILKTHTKRRHYPLRTQDSPKHSVGNVRSCRETSSKNTFFENYKRIYIIFSFVFSKFYLQKKSLKKPFYLSNLIIHRNTYKYKNGLRMNSATRFFTRHFLNKLILLVSF